MVKVSFSCHHSIISGRPLSIRFIEHFYMGCFPNQMDHKRLI